MLNRPHLVSTLIAAVIALMCVGLLTWSHALSSLDRSWHDRLQRTFAPHEPVPDNSAFVLVDEQSLQALGREPYTLRWPWPRKAFAGLFAALHQAGARAIVADFIFFENSDAGEDALLGAVSAGIPELSLGSLDQRLPIFWPAEFRQAHPEAFKDRFRWGSVQVTPDADGVIRHLAVRDALATRGLTPAQSTDLPASARLRWSGGLASLKARGVPALPAAPFVAAGLQALAPALDTAPDLDPTALIRALEKQPPPAGDIFEKVRGKVVFVGANAPGTFDEIATPVGAPEPGVLAHWTSWANASQGRYLQDVGPAASLGLLLGLTALIAWLGRRGIGLRGPALATAAGVVGCLVLSAAAFASGHWIAPAAPVAASLAAFSTVAVVSFRLERARKREIQGWFGAYVSPTVVQKLIANPDALKLIGERSELTVFFSDLVGFTALSEKLPAEQLVRIVNLCLDELSTVIFEQGGYVDKYIGDAVMGVFGNPEELPNHASAACRAALGCLRRLDSLNARLQSEFGVQLAIRIGLNTGEAVVGNIGSQRKKNFTVLGDAVNLAARLEGANKAFDTRILVGPRTAAAASDILTRPVARLRVKGKTEAVDVHEPLAVRAEADLSTQQFASASVEGFHAYLQADFSTAAHAYARAASLRPDDTLSLRYRDASLRFSRENPPPDWDPTVSLETK